MIAVVKHSWERKMTKTALITGASTGLGAEFTKIFAREGYDLIITARSEDKLNALKEACEKEYKIKVDVIAMDLSEINAAQKLYDKVSGRTLDVLINNAGFGDYGPFVELGLDRLTNMIQLNIMALAQMTRLVLPDMIERKSGYIMNLASIASFEPGPLMAMYYATKAFVLSLTEAISIEIKGTGVTISALCPGPTNTEFASNAHLERTSFVKAFKKTSPKDVAEYGYKQLMAGKVVAVPGALNKVAVVAAQVMPRALVRHCVKVIQK